jgi:hypothetical protein
VHLLQPLSTGKEASSYEEGKSHEHLIEPRQIKDCAIHSVIEIPEYHGALLETVLIQADSRLFEYYGINRRE